MKRIIIFIAFMAFTLVSCNDDIERHEPTPPINQTDSTGTPTPTPASSEIKVGICWSGMSSTGVTYYTSWPKQTVSGPVTCMVMPGMIIS